MPRRVDPKAGQDGFEKSWESLTFANAPFVKALDLIEENQQHYCRAGFQAKLVTVGNCYRRWKGRGASAFTRAEAAKALQPIAAGKPADMWTINGLNERALSGLHDSLVVLNRSEFLSGEPLCTVLMDGRVPPKILTSAAQVAICNLRSKSGPDRDGEIDWAVHEICDAYENFTRKPVTLSNKGERFAYEQEPQSAAGRFVLACMKEIDSSIPNKIPPSRIGSAIRSFIERR